MAKSNSNKISTSAAGQKPVGDTEAFAPAAECLRTLAHPVRLRIVQLLLHGRYSVGELADDCGIPDNVASEHLRLMQRCGFFTSEREGRKVFYQIAEPHLASLMACIENRFIEPYPSDD
ncbi:putative HTH-type transcriptional regulator [Planctomycetes bacterium CA13]|uniref:Putative HTH-type transcriptional regulator n=1 Tax=Novipirellula herctigrandis TaxID=2527986 RepID=A0A5C5YXQ9_9BACT|nr:putative HTH-type transcriptional regulator [Planctomycetes bacterium CA13]